MRDSTMMPSWESLMILMKKEYSLQRSIFSSSRDWLRILRKKLSKRRPQTI
jgi:hypothetical protein